MSKKKLGLCVCYDTKNYGSMLQTLATLLQVEKLSYDYEIIHYSRKLTFDLMFRSIGRVPEFLRKKKKSRIRREAYKKYPEIYDGVKKRNRCFEKFMDSKFKKRSVQYDTFNQIQHAAKNYDAIMVGSDQLWRPEGYSTGFYNLMFVPDTVPKIAYATSFGVSQIPESKKKIAKKFLSRMNNISVRELRASEIIKELTGRTVPTVVDPTLLFRGKEWESIIPHQYVLDEKERYIFCYLLGNNEEHRRQVVKIKEATGCKIVTIPHLDEFVQSDVSFGDIQLFNVGPPEFVNLIRNAEYICTDSFHGTVFSLLNHKKFVTFSRFSNSSKNSRNSRIESLFEQLNLKQRHYVEGDIITKMQRDINYNDVELKLSAMRKKSILYLRESLDSIK